MGSPTDLLKSDNSKRTVLRLLLRCTIAATSLLGASVGMAQKAPSPSAANAGLEEVIVTAQKREENLQDVPSSIVALSADDLQQRGISNVSNLMSGAIPSLRVEPFAGNQSVLEIGIRGLIDPNGTDITNENLVPIYIDDVYYGRQISTALELNDLGHLEVLRGPQGTLFGKNAAGGALLLVSKEPTGQLGLDLKGEVGNYSYWKGAAHINLPSVGGVAAKIDLLGTDSKGWTDNPAQDQQDYGALKSTAGKLTLLYKSDALSAEYAGDYTDLKTTESWNAQISDGKDFYNSVWGSQTKTPKSEPWATYRPYDPQVYWGHRLNLSAQLSDDIKIKSITAYRQDKATLYNTAANASTVPGPFFSPGFLNPTSPTFLNCVLGPAICGGALTGVVPIYYINHRQASEELQLSGKREHLDWVVGLFYLKESGSQTEITYFDTLLLNALGGSLATGFLPLAPTGSVLISSTTPGFGPVSTAGASITSKSSAAFGQFTWKPASFDDRFAVTAGVRFSKEEKNAARPVGQFVWTTVPYSPGPGLPGAAGSPCPQTPGCSPSISVTKTSPLLTLSYDWTKDVSTYVRYATGYQAPGLSIGSQLFQYVKESTVSNYELGLKSEFADHTVRLNVAAFHMDWKDPQENVQTTSSSTVEFFSGPTIKISGAEVELNYVPAPRVKLDASLTLLHGSQPTINNPYPPPGSTGAVPTPLHIVNLPDWAGSLAANFDLAHTDYGLWRLSVQANGTADYFTVPNSAINKGYWLLDGRLALTDIAVGSSGKLEVALWGKNLADESYRNFTYSTPGTVPGTSHVAAAYGMPRTYGLAVQYKFN